MMAFIAGFQPEAKVPKAEQNPSQNDEISELRNMPHKVRRGRDPKNVSHGKMGMSMCIGMGSVNGDILPRDLLARTYRAHWTIAP